MTGHADSDGNAEQDPPPRPAGRRIGPGTGRQRRSPGPPGPPGGPTPEERLAQRARKLNVDGYESGTNRFSRENFEPGTGLPAPGTSRHRVPELSPEERDARAKKLRLAGGGFGYEPPPPQPEPTGEEFELVEDDPPPAPARRAPPASGAMATGNYAAMQHTNDPVVLRVGENQALKAKSALARANVHQVEIVGDVLRFSLLSNRWSRLFKILADSKVDVYGLGRLRGPPHNPLK